MDLIFLTSDLSKKLYEKVKYLPIIDYHCHLSPKEIYEDKVFSNIGEMWLQGDHYKWRLMRAYGIDEHYITGSASYYEKFICFAKALEHAINNPLYHWSHMELKTYFNINLPITSENAPKIWEEANKHIEKTKMSPRTLITSSNVEYIATTDDPCDTLSYHGLLREDKTFKTKVTPSFRTDNLMQINKENYPDYIKRLSDISGVEICDIQSLKKAIINRLDFFCENGCRFSDIGIPDFPTCIGCEEEANEAFQKRLGGTSLCDAEYNLFLGHMYVFLASEYKKRDIIMQLHLCVIRNPNTALFNSIGADCGCDSIGEAIPLSHLARLFDKLNSMDALPKTICYTLNPQMYYPLAVLCRSFRNIHLGAAWWFCDHKRGIIEQLEIYSETSNLSTFFGMLTDSRSFLSYARHDYFRRILCSFVADKLISGEFMEEKKAIEILEKICYNNIKEITK